MTKMAVHNGVFHADEVFGVALIKGIYEDLEVIRTRDEAVLATCDLVADVGGGKYDHHQMDKKLREDGIPYCAFGLLWQDFGKAYIEKNFPNIEDNQQKQEIVERIAKDFITQIDASDNGVDVNTYEVPITTLSAVISSFMPFGGTPQEVEEGFKEAIVFATSFFYKVVRKYASFYEDYNYIKEEIEKQPVAETRFLVLGRSAGWKEPVLTLDEKEHILFIVFEDLTGSWRVQTVPKEPKSFAARCDLPAAWGGLREDELCALTGISGCIFCHPSLFICGNHTKEGALAMAKLAVDYNL